MRVAFFGIPSQRVPKRNYERMIGVIWTIPERFEANDAGSFLGGGPFCSHILPKIMPRRNGLPIVGFAGVCPGVVVYSSLVFHLLCDIEFITNMYIVILLIS